MIAETSELKNLDLECPESLAFTTPVSFRFSRCLMAEVSSWRELYGEVLKQLCQKYPAFLQKDTSLPKGFQPDEVGNLKASKKMKVPVNVRRGMYAETGLSTNAILRHIVSALDFCSIPLRDLKVSYYVDEEKKAAFQASHENGIIGQQPVTLNWDYTGNYIGSKPISFRYKRKRVKQVQTWAELYLSVILCLQDDYPKIIKDGVVFGKGTKPDICKIGKQSASMQHPVRIDKKLVLETYGSSTQLISRIYEALLLCGLNPTELVIQFTFTDEEKNLAYKGKKRTQIKTADNYDGKLIRRLRFLLGKHFENGYRIESAIDKNRLQAFYEKQYREAFPFDEMALKEALQFIAKPVAGKILLKNQRSTETLIKSILAKIEETFLNGATCIYLSELLSAYQQSLSECDIHDQESLGQLILAYTENRYRISHNRICAGRIRPDVPGEIRKLLKEQGAPASLESIEGKLWYIPSAVLEREIYFADDIVTCGTKQFYYAPSLPIKKSEETMIRDAFSSFLAIQPKMTELEFLDIILQICPHLLTEVPFLSWRGLRDSLGYTFRDVISIRDAEIVAAS